MTAAAAGPAVLLLVRRTSSPGAVTDRWGDLATVLAASAAAWIVLTEPSGLALLPLAVIGCAAATIDAREGRLPDPLTAAAGLCTLFAVAMTSGDLMRPTGAALLAGAIALLAKLIVGAAIGWGDVKLVPTVGVVLHHHDAVLIGVLNMALLVVAAAVWIGLEQRRGGLVPYGPAIVFGTLAAVANG